MGGGPFFVLLEGVEYRCFGGYKITSGCKGYGNNFPRILRRRNRRKKTPSRDAQRQSFFKTLSTFLKKKPSSSAHTKTKFTADVACKEEEIR